MLPLSVAALVACAVLLLLLTGGSAAIRGQLLDADHSALSGGGGGRGDLHQTRPRDGEKPLLSVSIWCSTALGPQFHRDS